MNKLIFVILVCLAASAHAGAGVGSLNHILVQIEQHVGAALDYFKEHLVQLIQQFKPELSNVLSVLNDFIGKLPHLQSDFIQKIKETLVNLVQMVLNGNARGVEGVKEVAEQRFLEHLQGLTTQLQTIAVSVVNHLLELLSGKPEIRFIDLSSILGNLNIQGIVDSLQGQLGNIVTSLLGQLLNGKRGFTDFIMNELGLAAVWNQISALGSGFVQQFFQIGTELLFAGQQIWAKAKVVLNQLLSDLTNHVGDASTIIAQAISSLNQILHKPRIETRGFTDFLLNTLGLSSVWAELQNIGGALLGNLITKLTQLLFAGQQAIASAKPILNQLVSDLTNHFGDAPTIVAQAISALTGILGKQRGLIDIVGNLLGGLNLGAIWEQVQAAGSGLLATLTAELAQLLVLGQNAINNAKPILQQLVADLTGHFGDAKPIIQQAINQLATVILNGNSQRNWISNITSALGLDAIWDQITAISSDMFAKLMAELAKLLFAGQAAWAQAQEIFGQLVSDLTNHVGDASTLIAQAISLLGQVVNKPRIETRGFTDFLLETLGLSSVWAELQNIGGAMLGNLIAKLTQLLFAGQQVIANAKPILNQLVSDLTSHFGDAPTIVAQAIASLTQILGQRGLVDVVGNLLGGLNLGAIWEQVQAAGSGLLAQLTAELAQLLVSGQQVINNAKPILQQLVADLTGHFGDAPAIIQQAVNQLAALLLNGQRNWISNIVSSLGLDQIWDQITSISSDMFAKLMAELTQLLFAGQAVWAEAKKIFAQLVSDLTNHVGDASTLIAQAINLLGQALQNNNKMAMDTRGFADFILNALGLGSVWDEIVGLGGNLWTQLLAAGGQLLLAGQQALNNAKPIIAQMVSDLTNHFGDASTIVAQAIASLTQVLPGTGKRGLMDTLGNLLGGIDLSGIVSELQNAGSALFGQLMAQLSSLIFAGQQAIANAKPIIQEMITNLTNHFGNAPAIVSQAIASLAAILNQQRGLIDIVGNLLGGLNLGAIWEQVQAAGSGLLAQLTAELAQLLVSGQQVINNAKPILQQLVADLTNHFGDAPTIIQQAINQLATVLLQGTSQRNWISNITASLGLDQIWDQITAVGTDVFAKLMAELAKLLFAGQAVWAQAQELFGQLVSDLTNHVGDASTIIAQAVSALGVLLQQ